MKKFIALFGLLAALSAPAWAATRTVTLSVPSMTCATCPITVKKALQKVEGVIEAKVTWEPKEAVLTFDDTRANAQELTEATRNAGYPATVKPQP
jgi:mercuric ion binding protein